MKSLFRHAGLDPASRRRAGESREPSQILNPGFHRGPWVPAFAGMTSLIERAIYKETLFNRVMGHMQILCNCKDYCDRVAPTGDKHQTGVTEWS